SRRPELVHVQVTRLRFLDAPPCSCGGDRSVCRGLRAGSVERLIGRADWQPGAFDEFRAEALRPSGLDAINASGVPTYIRRGRFFVSFHRGTHEAPLASPIA